MRPKDKQAAVRKGARNVKSRWGNRGPSRAGGVQVQVDHRKEAVPHRPRQRGSSGFCSRKPLWILNTEKGIMVLKLQAGHLCQDSQCAYART